MGEGEKRKEIRTHLTTAHDVKGALIGNVINKIMYNN